MPENMSRKFYEWPDLVQLYRDADVIAVCLVDNRPLAKVPNKGNSEVIERKN